MKFDGVRRGVNSVKASREPGSAPALGRVSKMRGYGRMETRRRRSRRSGHSQPRPQETQVIAWSIGVGLAALAVLGAVFTFWLLPRLRGAVSDVTKPDRTATEDRIRVVSKFRSPTDDEALTLVHKALAVRNPDKVETLIRPGSMTPSEVLDFLNSLRTVDGDVKDCIWLSSIDRNNMSLEGVEVVFSGFGKPRSRLAILTPDHDGVWKLDFPSFARWVQPSWKDLLDKKAESGVVRVIAARGFYFNRAFKDETKWVAYKMTSPDIDDLLFGYCKRGSNQHKAMELLWQRGETPVARATLEIRRPQGEDAADGTERVQFEISRVLAEDWVMGDKAFDENLP